MMNCSIFNDIGNSSNVLCLLRALTVSLTGGTWHLIYQRKWGLRMYSAVRKFALHMPCLKVCLHLLMMIMMHCEVHNVNWYQISWNKILWQHFWGWWLWCYKMFPRNICRMMYDVWEGSRMPSWIPWNPSACVNMARVKFCAMRVRFCSSLKENIEAKELVTSS